MDLAARRFLFEDDFVVPFPYLWITNTGGKRVLWKYVGGDDKTNRGVQGQPLPVGKKI